MPRENARVVLAASRRVAGHLLRTPGPPVHILTAEDVNRCEDPGCAGACRRNAVPGVGLPLCCFECGCLLVVYTCPADGVIALGCPRCKGNYGELELPHATEAPSASGSKKRN